MPHRDRTFTPSRTLLSVRTFPGARASLLLLHGVLTSHRYFSRPLGGRLGCVRLVLPDLLGFGDSAAPEIGYTLDDHLACLEDLVAAEGPPGPLFLGGHSLGCLVATALAARLPAGRVAGMVFLNYPRFTSPALIHDTLRNGSRHYREVTRGLGAPSEKELLDISADAIRKFARLLPPPLQEEAHRTSPLALGRTVRNCLFAYRPDPDLDRLAGLPMLFLLSGRDEVAPPAFILERRADLPNARWAAVEGAGHHLVYSHTGLVADAICAFLEQHAGRAEGGPSPLPPGPVDKGRCLAPS